MTAITRPSIRDDGKIATLTAVQAVIYKVPASAVGPIQCITVHNRDTASRTYNLLITRNGVTMNLSPSNHVIPAGAIWTYERQEIAHYMRGGEGDQLEGFADVTNVVDVIVSVFQLDINA